MALVLCWPWKWTDSFYLCLRLLLHKLLQGTVLFESLKIPHSIPKGVLSPLNIWVCVLKAALRIDVLSISYFYSVIFLLSTTFTY